LFPTANPTLATITVIELAHLVGGEIIRGEAAMPLVGLNALGDAVKGDVSFLGNPRYAKALRETQASAALVPTDFVASSENVPAEIALIGVANPTLAFSRVIEFFCPVKRERELGIHPTAVIADSAKLVPELVSIGAHVIIGEGTEIGEGTVVLPGAYIGSDVKIGRDCVLHANCTIKERCLIGDRVVIHSGAVIGTDGFGYELINGRHQKIDQVGIVEIENDVEIGSCATIDRARFGSTLIGEGTKIDNLVQIGHNVRTGKHCILVSQTGISGSTKLGDYVVMGGQVGVAGHLKIGDRVSFMAKSGVTKDHQEPGVYTGFPARPIMEGRRMLASPAKVPELIERVRQLEKKIEALQQKASE